MEAQKGPSAPPGGTPLPGSRKGVRPAPVRTVYLRMRMDWRGPDCFQEEPGGVQEGSLDIKGGDDEVHRVHVGDGVLEEDSLVW